MFMEALNTLGALNQPAFGQLQPDETVNLYFNLSNGPDADQRGPWNSEPAFQYVADPLQHEMQTTPRGFSGNEMAQLYPNSYPPGTGAPPAHPIAPVPVSQGPAPAQAPAGGKP